jgi:hypothetical protein
MAMPAASARMGIGPVQLDQCANIAAGECQKVRPAPFPLSSAPAPAQHRQPLRSPSRRLGHAGRAHPLTKALPPPPPKVANSAGWSHPCRWELSGGYSQCSASQFRRCAPAPPLLVGAACPPSACPRLAARIVLDRRRRARRAPLRARTRPARSPALTPLPPFPAACSFFEGETKDHCT